MRWWQAFGLLLLCGCAAACSDKNASPRVPAKTQAPAPQVPDEDKSRLKALGYVTWDEISEEEREKAGVTRHQQDKAYGGLNAYCSENTGTFNFMDMRGQILHSVSVDLSALKEGAEKCKLAEFSGDGSLIMLVASHGLVKVDLSSKVQWHAAGAFHHDLDIHEDGSIVALTKLRRRHAAFDEQHQIVDNEIVTLDPKGAIVERISFGEMVAKSPPLLAQAKRHMALPKHKRGRSQRLDLFHLNTIEIIRKRVEYDSGLSFEEGDLLFCSRYLNAIGVIDPKQRRIKWSWGTPTLQWPHHPIMLPDGNIIVFDNGFHRKYSQVLVVSPDTGEVVWSYQAEPPSDFFSRSRGSAQQLPNENVLITDSQHGHVFEITRKGETVWEFFNPHMKPDKSARSTVYRMTRFTGQQANALRFPAPVKQKLREAGLLAPTGDADRGKPTVPPRPN